MPPSPIDFEKLLRFFQEMYAHALTLQDLIETDDKRTYEEVKPQYDRLAENEFALFYRALNQPEVFASAVREFLDKHAKSGPVQ